MIEFGECEGMNDLAPHNDVSLVFFHDDFMINRVEGRKNFNSTNIQYRDEMSDKVEQLESPRKPFINCFTVHVMCNTSCKASRRE